MPDSIDLTEGKLLFRCSNCDYESASWWACSQHTKKNVACRAALAKVLTFMPEDQLRDALEVGPVEVLEDVASASPSSPVESLAEVYARDALSKGTGDEDDGDDEVPTEPIDEPEDDDFVPDVHRVAIARGGDVTLPIWCLALYEAFLAGGYNKNKDLWVEEMIGIAAIIGDIDVRILPVSDRDRAEIMARVGVIAAEA